MSLVDGVHCTWPACRQLTFLPLACPGCQAPFCEAHAQPSAHACTAPHEKRERADASHETRVVCQKAQCQKPTLAVAGAHAVTHNAPRCERCHGLFCPSHRSAVAHGCTAPAPLTEGAKRAAAAEARRARAQAVLAKHFPKRP